MYGAGFENRPDLVARLADGRELLGTPPELLAPVRDPRAVAAAARAAGARAPETRSAGEPPEAPGQWLRKPRHGGGGRGVRRWAGGRLSPAEILQRRVHGLSCSAVAIGDGRRAAVLGLTEQLHRPRSFQWMGNVAPPRLPPPELAELDGQLRAVCDEVAARFGVRGSVRCGRDLGRAPRVGARGQPATARRTRAVRTGHVRSARARRTRPGPPNPRHPPGDQVCEGEARAVRSPRRPRPRARLVAGGPRARHTARRRDDQGRRPGVHAAVGHRRASGAGRARDPPAGRATSRPVPAHG